MRKHANVFCNKRCIRFVSLPSNCCLASCQTEKNNIAPFHQFINRPIIENVLLRSKYRVILGIDLKEINLYNFFSVRLIVREVPQAPMFVIPNLKICRCVNCELFSLITSLYPIWLQIYTTDVQRMNDVLVASDVVKSCRRSEKTSNCSETFASKVINSRLMFHWLLIAVDN